jgi:hypothetical protein
LEISGDLVEDLVGGLGPHKRPGLLVPGVDPDWIEPVDSGTDRWLPRRSHLLVNSANHRSTRFNHEL